MSDNINLNSKINIKLNKDKRYLLAMSGGLDSVVLFDLLIEYGCYFEVAHVNYMLREEDSILDDQFVTELCLKHDIICHKKNADIDEYKESRNASTQMAAREIRYSWFDELILNRNLDYILTAHHLNDSIETFFINLMRGTGIYGLKGINSQGNLIRPFLYTSKQCLLNYAIKNDILWREDISNFSNEYLRNKVRNLIVPKILEIDDNFLENFSKTFSFISNDIIIIESYISNLKKKLFKDEKDGFIIKISKLEKFSDNSNILFYLFAPYGFKNPNEITKLMYANNSAEITSFSHRLIRDRKFLILKKKIN